MRSGFESAVARACRSNRWRAGWGARALVVFGVAAGVLAAPVASASACPSFKTVASFHGTASTSFSGSASGSDGSGGTQTVSLSRTASDLQLNLATVATGVGIVYGAQPGVSPSGGSISVNDQYTDTNTAGNTSGSESGSGPTISEGSAAVLNFFPGSCTYQLLVEWSIDTTPTGTAQPGDDTAEGHVHTALMAIPASLKLSGSVSVPVYNDKYCSQHQAIGCYWNSSGWASAYDHLYTYGQREGTATVSWSINPVNADCVVPKLKAKTLAQAKSALNAAGCQVGKVTSKTSFTTPKGRVISSNPAAGKKLKLGAKVDLVISGPPCVVPSLIGQEASTASSLLAAANCTLGKVTKKYSPVGKGKIISNSPKAGSKLFYGAPVAITVSLGPATCSVPKFLPGEPLVQAKMFLKAANCSVGTITYQHSSTVAKGRVITSKPKPGTKKLPAYTPVALTVSSGP